MREACCAVACRLVWTMAGMRAMHSRRAALVFRHAVSAKARVADDSFMVVMLLLGVWKMVFSYLFAGCFFAGMSSMLVWVHSGIGCAKVVLFVQMPK